MKFIFGVIFLIGTHALPVCENFENTFWTERLLKITDYSGKCLTINGYAYRIAYV